MSKMEKRVKKFIKNPTSLKYSEIETILFYFRFEKINAKGSHVKFKHIKLQNDLVVPVHGNDCKNFYKLEIRKIIKKIINLT